MKSSFNEEGESGPPCRDCGLTGEHSPVECRERADLILRLFIDRCPNLARNMVKARKDLS